MMAGKILKKKNDKFNTVECILYVGGYSSVCLFRLVRFPDVARGFEVL